MTWFDSTRRQRELETVPKYRLISLKTDARWFLREMLEKLLDALNYAQWAKEKGEATRRDWKVTDGNR